MGHPKIWKEVEKTKDGKPIKIRMQEVTEDLIEPVVEHMTEYFAAREPICNYLKLKDDPVSLNDLKHLWRTTLKGGASIVAILLNDDGSVPTSPLIVGANVTGISAKGESTYMGSGKAYRLLLKPVIDITKEGNLYDKYKVDKYLTALGLSVHRDYHGLGLGHDILNSREAVCKNFGLTMTATVFTAASSQHIAAKCGFERIVERDYKDVKVDGVLHYKDLPGKISLSAKTY